MKNLSDKTYKVLGNLSFLLPPIFGEISYEHCQNKISENEKDSLGLVTIKETLHYWTTMTGGAVGLMYFSGML